MSPTTHGKGYGISDTKNYTDFSVQSYPLKTPGPHDVTLDIDFCGVCGSDVHTVTGGWGGLNADFVVPGHEIIGKVTHVGEEVTEFKVGQRVGVGAQVFGCLKCERCKSDNENYCAEQVDTYNAKYRACLDYVECASTLPLPEILIIPLAHQACAPSLRTALGVNSDPSLTFPADGVLAQGGYSSSIRVHDRWVFAIPEAIKSEDAAPMLCAGLTVYSPLLRNGAGPGKTVGIVGIGGLGHFAIQFAKALGARVVVFSHSPSKKDDCLSLGADEFVTTDTEGFEKPFFDKIDYILSCADVETIPLGQLASTLKVGGLVTSVGLPDGEWKGLQPQLMASNASSIGCSHIGSKKEANSMLKLAAEKGIKPIIDEILPMSKAGDAIQRVKDNKVRYRFVLKQDLN